MGMLSGARKWLSGCWLRKVPPPRWRLGGSRSGSIWGGCLEWSCSECNVVGVLVPVSIDLDRNTITLRCVACGRRVGVHGEAYDAFKDLPVTI